MNVENEKRNADVAVKPDVLEEYSSEDDDKVDIEDLVGDKTIVYASHVEDETNYKGAINYVGKWRGNVDIPVGTVVAVNAHHLDSHRWKSIEQKCFFYAAVMEQDLERFPNKEKNWVQIKAVANGDYVVNWLEGHNNPNFVFDVIIHCQELEIIALPGTKDYEVFADDYGKNPMRWFKMNSEGEWFVRILYGERYCQDCLDPGCIINTDKTNEGKQFSEEIAAQKRNELNKELRFKAYKAITLKKYGVLGKGVRRKLGICCELYVRSKFPANNDEDYG